MRAIARDVTELFDCRGLSNPAAIKGKTQQSNRTQEQDDPKTTQLSLGDYDRMRVVKPDSVPTQLTTKYRELFVSSGMTQTDAWNNALNDYEKSGHAVQPEKHQAYRDGCERFVTDTDYERRRNRVVEAATKLVTFENVAAIRATDPNSEVDWANTRREAVAELREENVPNGIIRLAQELADCSNQRGSEIQKGLTTSTAALLKKLESKQHEIAEKAYPEARIWANHEEAWNRVGLACAAEKISPPSILMADHWPDLLNADQHNAVEQAELNRQEIATKHYITAREADEPPSVAIDLAQKALRKELGIPYATLPTGMDHEKMEARVSNLVNGVGISNSQVASSELAESFLTTVDEYGMAPIHHAAARGRLNELKNLDPVFLKTHAGSNADQAVRAASIQSTKRFKIDPVIGDLSGITAEKMAVQFGHGAQLVALGIDPQAVKSTITKGERIAMGYDGKEMVALQYHPLPVIYASRYRQKLGLDLQEAMSATNLKFSKIVGKYSPTVGTSLMQYSALQFQGSMKDEVRSKEPRTDAAVEQDKKIDDTKMRLAAELGRTPESREVAERLGISEVELGRLEFNVTRPHYMSMDAPIDSEHGSIDKHELIADEDFATGLDEHERKIVREGLASAIKKLEPHECQTVALLFACNCKNQDVAWLTGQSAQTVCSIAVKARELMAAEPSIQRLYTDLRKSTLSEAELAKDPAKQPRNNRSNQIVQGD